MSFGLANPRNHMCQFRKANPFMHAHTPLLIICIYKQPIDLVSLGNPACYRPENWCFYMHLLIRPNNIRLKPTFWFGCRSIRRRGLETLAIAPQVLTAYWWHTQLTGSSFFHVQNKDKIPASFICQEN